MFLKTNYAKNELILIAENKSELKRLKKVSKDIWNCKEMKKGIDVNEKHQSLTINIELN